MLVRTFISLCEYGGNISAYFVLLCICPSINLYYGIYTVRPLCSYVLHICTYVTVCSYRHTAAITNRMATVIISDLQCGVLYNITAEGALNGTLVGPKSPHGNVTAGPCPVIASTYVYVCAYTYCVFKYVA